MVTGVDRSGFLPRGSRTGAAEAPRRGRIWNTILSDARRPLILLGFAAAIPVILFAGWVAYLTAAEERASARRTAYDAVERVTERVAAELSKQLQVVETLATSSSFDEPNLRAFYTEAERLKGSRPLWETVELVDPNGTQVVNLLRPLGSRTRADRRHRELREGAGDA